MLRKQTCHSSGNCLLFFPATLETKQQSHRIFSETGSVSAFWARLPRPLPHIFQMTTPVPFPLPIRTVMTAFFHEPEDFNATDGNVLPPRKKGLWSWRRSDAQAPCKKIYALDIRNPCPPCREKGAASFALASDFQIRAESANCISDGRMIWRK